MARDSDRSVFEFFAGGGMARLGLGAAWRVAFANDVDPAKARAYAAAFGSGEFHLADIGALSTADLPGRPALAWASFPCQDLSLAGARSGLAGDRSRAFFAFWRLMEGLARENRAPGLIVLENVTGLLTSRGGADFTALAGLLAEAGYRFGALEIDARWFVPQSRPRIFIVARRGAALPALEGSAPVLPYHSRALIAAARALPAHMRASWAWWSPPPPPTPNARLDDVLDDPPIGACWNEAAKTERLLDLMSPLQRARVAALAGAGGRHVGALFRRIRREQGERRQRVEARFDGLAGCLRTPAGGSSRQSVIVIEDGRIRTRLLSAREAARLMGLPEDYPLPASHSAALHLLGDGVAVPVVRWLSERLLEPLAQVQEASLVAIPPP